jgi:hypothetical protein
MAVTFEERQRFGPWWLWVLVGACAIAGWAGAAAILATDDADATIGALALALGVGVLIPVLFLTMHLDVQVDAQEIRIRYFPFVRRVIPLTEIVRVDARRYHPLREYGGWGIKGWTTRKIAYNVKGDEGVDLTLLNGRTVLVGSQRAGELAAAIDRARGVGQRNASA